MESPRRLGCVVALNPRDEDDGGYDLALVPKRHVETVLIPEACTDLPGERNGALRLRVPPRGRARC